MMDVAELQTMEPAVLATELLGQPEDQWFDRKSARVGARALAETMIAMANAEGGLIAIGIHDGTLDGPWSPQKENGWRQAPLDYADPPVRATFTPAQATTGGGDGTVMLVEVRASSQIHATSKDEVHLRVGDENRRLTYEQRQELEFDKGQSTFEATAPRFVETASLAPKLLLHDETAESLLRQTGARSIEGLLTARGLMTADGLLTVGGLLLVGQNPQAELPSAHVRVTRHTTSERTTGARQQIDYDDRFDGPLPVQLTEAISAVQNHVASRRALTASGTFADVDAIPRDAWVEAVVNAVAHRSYSMAGDHIRVWLFPDRIEVESPGRFPGVVDLANPTGVARFARNPRIARILADLDFTQELGEGIKRMFEEMQLAGLGQPQYHQTAGSVRLTLSAEPVDKALERRLPPKARDVLRILRDRGRASTGELAASLDRSRPTVLEQLKALQDDQLIEWVGNSPKDPRAYWKLP